MHNLASHGFNQSLIINQSQSNWYFQIRKHDYYTVSVWLTSGFQPDIPMVSYVLSLFLLSLCGVPFVVECWDESCLSSGIHLTEAFSCHSLPLRPLNYSNSWLTSVSPSLSWNYCSSRCCFLIVMVKVIAVWLYWGERIVFHFQFLLMNLW